MNDQPTLDDMMSEYAQDAVDFVKQQYSIELDFSESSVEQVEEILGALHEMRPKGFLKRMFKKSLGPKQVDQLAKMFGGYIGEVMKKQWGASWKLGSEAFPGEQVVTLTIPPSGDLWPHFKAGKRIINGPEDNVWHYYLYFKEKQSQT